MIKTPNWVRGICIGKGSFGTVNLAVDKSDGAVFAVKSVIHNSGRFSDALENEIHILKSLSSNYVVGYRGDDVTPENDATVYRNLHMEYMPGGTVADLGKQSVDDVTVRSYTRCITSALSYIHRRNIVHCDVKGKNVLIGSDPGVAKLADFGSAVEMGAPITNTRGSPLWMAPEVVRREYQGPESDVWSLGCTVIEMVTGNPAWQDRGVDTLFQIGYSDELPNIPAEFSGELRDFLSKCLRRNHWERWSSDQLLQHPFLLPCSSSPELRKWSPRCVFDWSESSFSDVSVSSVSDEIEVSHVNLNTSYARQRISELSSNSSANWDSDGWELVRDTVVSATVDSSESEIAEEQVVVVWPEYSLAVGNNDGEGTIRGSERTNREYGDSNGSFDDGGECTNDHAQSTRGGCNSRDMDNYDSCCVFVSLNRVLLFNPNSSDIFIMKFCFCLMLDQFLILLKFIIFLLIFSTNFHFNTCKLLHNKHQYNIL